MCTTKLSPTAVTGSPVASISIPELSIATCPWGSHSSWKIVGGSAGIVRWTSSRSVVVSVISASCHGPFGGSWKSQRDAAGMDLNHLNLRVRDAAACRDFYQSHFGFRPAFEAEAATSFGTTMASYSP